MYDVDLGTRPAYMHSAIGGGQRSHAANAYLHPIDNRTNLDILINTQVTRLIRSGTDRGVPAFRQVSLAQFSGGASCIVCVFYALLIMT